jgi:uncharacterized protein
MMDYVLFHAKKTEPFSPCIDGLFAAYAARIAMPRAKLVPAVYNQKPTLNLSFGDRVFLLDVTYPAAVLESWADAGAVVEVIDHHKTAMQDLSGLSDRIVSQFDMSRSGAVLAWRRFVENFPLPQVYRYVQDRDLWTKGLPECDTIALGLSEIMHGKTLEQCLGEIDRMPIIDGVPEIGLVSIRDLGRSIEAERDRAIQQAIANSFTRLVLGEPVAFVVCEGNRQHQAYSDIGHALLNARPDCRFAVVQTGRGWALRSNASHADVSAIAKSLGGGGHRDASGCGADMPRWAALLSQRLHPKWAISTRKSNLR